MSTNKKSSRTITVAALARVEGEGGLTLQLRGGRVADVKLRIYEPPRFFEGFLRGRDFREVPDVTARICGICPVAYQMSSIHALEAACGVSVTPEIRALRRLLYCGEWIESHALHVFMLHAPDFLGYESAIHMAKDHVEVVTKALELKKIGNDLVTVVGGREIHPVNVKLGGFYRAPTRLELAPLVERLKRALALSLEAVRFTAGLEFPGFEPDYEFVALRHPDEYPFNEGRIVSSRGLDIPVAEFEEHFVEEHVAHANALHCVHKGHGAYHVGPLARYSLNFDRLPGIARDAAREAGLGTECRNPFKSIVVRAVELVFACHEALRIIGSYAPPEPASVAVPPRAGSGHGASEAPRGMLYHSYQIDADGLVRKARIVPPTAQNQRTIENDLRELVPTLLELPREELTLRCEQAIRNYDPCISCATHFLKLDVREG
ncbi:MAG TPA: Ni/Fe hydrogenase subunit alpha [Vicinamibacteria bacterium]|nr:Ni/Fe hydrogenase subunit alpha [Vicinamibacteria bacterium]